jgi:hypothetical protein
MRTAFPLLLLLAACSSAPPRQENPGFDEALRLARVPDWPRAREAAERAHLLDPKDQDSALLLARMLLFTFGEVEEARALCEAAGSRHGLALCALAEGRARRAEELLGEAPPTAACLRDRALLLLGQRREAEAGKALDEVAKRSAGATESDLLLAAAGRIPPPPLPREWWFGLARARVLAKGGDREGAERELVDYARLSCATPAARALLRRSLEGDFALSGLAGVVENGK